MGRMISLIIALLFSLPAYAQVDVTISPAGSNAGSSGGVVSPNVSQPKPYRPSGPISGPRAHAGDYEDFCIADQPSSCNFMKHGTVGRWIDEEQQVTHHKLSELQNELSVREAALDKDLAALRSGGVMNGSSYGATVQAKIDATAAAQIRTTALAASRQKILADVSAANHAAIDRAVAAADEAAPKSDMAGAVGSIEKSVGSYYIRERLDREFKRADTVEMRIRAEGGQYERDRLILASDGRYALDSARSNLELGLLERSQYALKLGARLLDVAIDFSPLLIVAAAPQATVAIGVAMAVSFAKDYYEARTGRRLLGGEALTVTERSAAMLGAVLAVAPVVDPSYKALAAASEGLAIFADVAKTAKVEARLGSDAASDLAGFDDVVRGAGEVLHSAKNIGASASDTMQDFVKWLKKPLDPNLERGAIGNGVDKTLEIIKDLRPEKAALEGAKLFEDVPRNLRPNVWDIMENLPQALKGNSQAKDFIKTLRPHELTANFNGWNSLDLVPNNPSASPLRFLYKTEADGSIKWMIKDTH